MAFFAPNEIFRFLFALPDARAHTRVAAEHASSGFDLILQGENQFACWHEFSSAMMVNHAAL